MVVGPTALPPIMQRRPCAPPIRANVHLKAFLRDIECSDARLLGSWGLDNVRVLKGHILQQQCRRGNWSL